MKIIREPKISKEQPDITLQLKDGVDPMEFITKLIMGIDANVALKGQRVNIIEQTPTSISFEIVDDDNPVPPYIAEKMKKLVDTKKMG